MAQTRSKRLQTVLWLAERKEQQAGKALQQYQQQLVLEQQQLQQLNDYSKGYADELRGMTTSSGPQLQQLRNFFQRLYEAESGQRQKVEQMNLEFERLRQDWLKMQHRRNAISDLIDRLKQEENAVIEKILQQELDEMAAKLPAARD